MKKLLLTLTAAASLFLISCEDAETIEDQINSQTDSSQYVTFIIDGDSLSHLFVNLDKGSNKTTQFLADSTTLNVGFSLYLKDSASMGATQAIFAFDGGANAVGAGDYPFGTGANTSNISLSLPDFAGSYSIVGQTGLTTITEYPDSVSKYILGTFSGTFQQNGDTTKSFMITGGAFRIKRTQ